ncbi:tRNA (adenosine(37)-N6)-dimethylallyltransferase MiaA [Sphingomonas montanisoli]|uniref:tRNA dimethylallyltransferase n=1 Tax=Sphingomonas montanisoli TaxID=2606412 RepID=A0A5D9CF48_9SPHN|nr:tRNA (adenosine(37)-N6)-dimethylallyltransferase MiaA [Sphingomonas montanisoli]TZG29620.1 tRNA (adenosine(37)-N6)-dimethylallyltransferase MiaA [Sphingomonas montanisoli]
MNTIVSPDRKPVALIAGPTASGKSALAMALAGIANGVVINADASQVYADLRVLSARPSVEDEATVPHRLFGYRDAADACSAADWAADARAAIAEVHDAGRLPIIVGGTGLYIRTLLFGIAPVPEIDPAIRATVRGQSVTENYAALSVEDPIMAARLRPSDTTRIARALEVIRSTKESISQWQERLEGGISQEVSTYPVILLPPREWLRARCDARFEHMLAAGAVAEVEALMTRELDPTLPAMRAIGVPEIAAWRAGDISREVMIERAQTATRQYAKRQYTWFRHQLPPEWPRIGAHLDANLIDKIAIKLREDVLTH